MIDKLEKELAENPLGPPWKQRISAKRAADWRRDREERVRQYKGELPEIEKELVEWQKTRIVYKALHAYYRKRHEEDKFIEKLAQDGYTNPIQILADLWSSESASVSVWGLHSTLANFRRVCDKAHHGKCSLKNWPFFNEFVSYRSKCRCRSMRRGPFWIKIRTSVAHCGQRKDKNPKF